MSGIDHDPEIEQSEEVDTESSDDPMDAASSEHEEEDAGETLDSLEFRCPITGRLMVDPVIAPDGKTYERDAYVVRAHRAMRAPLSVAGMIVRRATNPCIQEQLLRPDDDLRDRIAQAKDRADAEPFDFAEPETEEDDVMPSECADDPSSCEFDDATSDEESDEESSVDEFDGAEEGDRLDVAPPPPPPPLESVGGVEGGVPVPDSFTCPITHELMKDPVFAADGQTYDRHAIERWLGSDAWGRWMSPMTNLQMGSGTLVPNYNLRSQIDGWTGSSVPVPVRQQHKVAPDEDSDSHSEEEFEDEEDDAGHTNDKIRNDFDRISQMRRLQRSTRRLIPEANFNLLAKEIAQDYVTDPSFTANALKALQEASEAYLVGIFQDSQLNACHRAAPRLLNKRKRLHVQPNDVQLARRIRMERI